MSGALDPAVETLVRKVAVRRILESLDGQLAGAGGAGWDRVRDRFLAAGVNGLVHGGSTGLICSSPRIAALRAIGDLDLLLADDLSYDPERAELALDELLEFVAERFGGRVERVPVPLPSRRENPWKADRARRYGSRYYALRLSCGTADLVADAGQPERFGLNGGDLRLLETAGSWPSRLDLDLKVSAKVGYEGGNLRPVLGYRNERLERVTPPAGALYPALLHLHPLCRLAIKLHYAVHPAAPEPIKSLCDIALLTGALGGPPLVDPEDPLLRLIFLVFTPVIQPRAELGSLAFERIDPRSPSTVQQTLASLEQVARRNFIALAPSPQLAEALLTSAFDTLRHLIGLERRGEDGYAVACGEATGAFLENCRGITSEDIGEREDRMRQPLQDLFREALPPSAASRSGLEELETECLYTISRFGVGSSLYGGKRSDEDG